MDGLKKQAMKQFAKASVNEVKGKLGLSNSNSEQKHH